MRKADSQRLAGRKFTSLRATSRCWFRKAPMLNNTDALENCESGDLNTVNFEKFLHGDNSFQKMCFPLAPRFAGHVWRCRNAVAEGGWRHVFRGSHSVSRFPVPTGHARQCTFIFPKCLCAALLSSVLFLDTCAGVCTRPVGLCCRFDELASWPMLSG
jgi:hypothetical protein